MAEKMKLFQKAKKYFPGGVNSPLRSFYAVDGDPLLINRASGSKIRATGGKTFIDYCMSWGALIFGHSNKDILKSVKNRLDCGTTYGFTNPYEIKLAARICETISSIEKIRFVNSGTEAALSAVRLARRYTGRDKVVRFEGCYHGSSELLLNKEMSFSVPYNDLNTAAKIVKRHHNKIACMIVEPVAGNMGVVPPSYDFLKGLRQLCSRYKILFIFDEVITGFRLTFGGYQNIINLKPDLTCLGKIIGGGFPAGAYGGKEEIMRLVSPEGDFYQAGTFSGNPVTSAAGLKTLEKLSRRCGADYGLINDKTEYLCGSIKKEAKKNNVNLHINRVGSMFSLFFAKEKITDYASATKQDIGKFKRFYKLVFNRGVLLSPSPFESNFVSFAHTDKDIEKTVKIISSVLGGIR